MTQDIYDPDYVANLFNRCSPRYRNWAAVSSFGMVVWWRKLCVARLSGQSNIGRIQDGHLSPQSPTAPVVYDLMAGTGEVWPHVLSAFPKARITAIDISERMHQEAKDKLHGTRHGQIEHIAANALIHDLPQAGADMLVATFGLKTFSADQQATLARQIARCLKPGGAFCLIEASDPKGWILRPLYRLYLDRVLPLVERLFLNGAQDFSMIGTYTAKFGDCTVIEQALRAQGLIVTQKRHFFGCATSVAGTKPIAQAPNAP
mgnify:CR=1 FL=1